MSREDIQKIRDSVDCYKEVHTYLKSSIRCHACFHAVPCITDFSDLRWIGDEQVICCGENSCEEQIRNLDKLSMALATGESDG